MSVCQAGANLIDEPFKCSSAQGLLALPTNNRLGWKGLHGQTLQLTTKITDKKSFITLAPWCQVPTLNFLPNLWTDSISCVRHWQAFQATALSIVLYPFISYDEIK